MHRVQSGWTRWWGLAALVLLPGCAATYDVRASDAESVRGRVLHTADDRRISLRGVSAVHGVVHFADRDGMAAAVDDAPRCRHAVLQSDERRESLEAQGWTFRKTLSFERDDVRVVPPIMRVRDRWLGCVEMHVDDVDHVEVVVGESSVGVWVALGLVGVVGVTIYMLAVAGMGASQ